MSRRTIQGRSHKPGPALLEARLAERRQQRDQQVANLNSTLGAIAELEALLEDHRKLAEGGNGATAPEG